MTYNLEEFKAWLAEDPARNEGTIWDYIFTLWSEVTKSNDPVGNWKQYPKPWQIVQRWIAERERESKWGGTN